MLEAMTRRYYRIRDLEDVKAFGEDGRPLRHRQLRAGRRPAGADLDAWPTTTTWPQRWSPLNAHGRPGASSRRNVVTDLYLAWPDAPGGRRSGVDRPARRTGRTQPALAAGRRVTVTVVPHRRTTRCSSSPSGRPADGLAEERVIRGMHPLTGQRLDLWRLKNFNGTRMPSAEGTYLFHLVAPNNPADERLVALAEVRDVTPLRDGDGKVVAFPSAERVLAACLESIRRVQAQRSGAAAAGQQPRCSCTCGRRSRCRCPIWAVRPEQRPADAGHRAVRDHRAGPAAAARLLASNTMSQ